MEPRRNPLPADKARSRTLRKTDARAHRPSAPPVNDSSPAIDATSIDAAFTRIAEAIGRQIAREHLRVLRGKRS
ncbi:MAG: hypothetical protein WCY11_12005 [Novosphingobium sp.]|jgi:hypothetical protein